MATSFACALTLERQSQTAPILSVGLRLLGDRGILHLRVDIAVRSGSAPHRLREVDSLTVDGKSRWIDPSRTSPSQDGPET